MGSRLASVSVYGAGLFLTVLSMASPVLAGAQSVAPEIDGTTVSMGLGLLAGAVLLLRSRRRTR